MQSLPSHHPRPLNSTLHPKCHHTPYRLWQFPTSCTSPSKHPDPLTYHKVDQCHCLHQDPPLSFTTLFSCRITLHTPQQTYPSTCTPVCHPNSPTTHCLLLALEFLFSLSAVLLHFHLCLFLCLLQTPGLPWRQKKGQGMGVNPHKR